jgi:glycosyltransferase involved in cell wall biosynthesis
MHILFLIDQLCEAGGAERVLLKTIEGLPKDQFACWLVTFKRNLEIEAFRQLPCPTYVLPLGRTYDLNAMRVAAKIRDIIHSNRIDIVHTFHETSDLWGGLVAKASGCPALVSSRRDMGILRTKKHNLGYPFINHFVDRVLAVSESVRNYCIQKDGLSPDKVLTLHNGIDLTDVDSKLSSRSCRCSLGIPATAPVITAVGHIRKVKGVDIFIRAAARVCQEFPEAIFLVVGSITERAHYEELQQLTNALGMCDHIKWAGAHKDIYSILKMSDVFCLPSRSEGFSNALIEAMACGLPCVATDVGGNGEAITDGVNGYLVQPEDPESMAARIVDLLRFPGQARKLGLAARAAVEGKFTYDVMIRTLVGIYVDLVASKRA